MAIAIETVPALACSFFVSKASCPPGSAASASFVGFPAAGDEGGAGVPVVAVGCVFVEAPVLAVSVALVVELVCVPVAWALGAAPASSVLAGELEVATAVDYGGRDEHGADRHDRPLLARRVGEARAAHADRHRDDQRPGDEHAAGDVEGSLALLGSQYRRQLEGGVHGREPSR